MRSRMICYVAGLTTIVWLPALPMPGSALLFFIVFFALTLLFKYRFSAGSELAIRWLCFGLGLVWAYSWSQWQLSHRLSADPVKADWQVEGTISGLPEITRHPAGRNARFVLHVESILPLNDALRLSRFKPRRLQLSWYRLPRDLLAKDLRPGTHLKLEVRLKPPHGLWNPGGSDYELSLLTRGIDATGYVRAAHKIQRSDRCGIDCLRAELLSYIHQRYTGADASSLGLLRALILGDRGGFGEHEWALLAETGTLHLAVISGLHIGFVALLVYWLLGWPLRQLWPRIALPVQVLVTLVATFAYVQLAGAGIPTQRAFVMIAVFLIVRMLLWELSLWTRWWIAMAVVLTLLPVASHTKGFWLSFGAVAVLLWCAQYGRRPDNDRIQLKTDFLRIQFVLFCGALPLTAYAFSALPLAAPFVNLLAIPLVAVLLVTVAADLFFSWATVFSLQAPVEWLADLFWRLLIVAQSNLDALWQVPPVPFLALILAFAGSWWIIHPSAMPARWLGVVMWLPLLLGTGQKQAEPDHGFSAWVLDTGQGTAVAIRSADKWLLYDTGPGYRSGGSAYPRVLGPFLREQRIRLVDRLIISHNDLDHTGGHGPLRKDAKIKSGLMGSPFLARRFGYDVCRSQSWQWGDVHFRILAGGSGDSDNNRSCVLLVQDERCSLLLTGDINRRKERTLIPQLQPVTWLMASHHGSNDGSGRAFLETVDPQVIIFSAGFANQFGHPGRYAYERAQASGARLMSTFETGAIHLSSQPSSSASRGCTSKSWRYEKPRFWFSKFE